MRSKEVAQHTALEDVRNATTKQQYKLRAIRMKHQRIVHFHTPEPRIRRNLSTRSEHFRGNCCVIEIYAAEILHRAIIERFECLKIVFESDEMGRRKFKV